ncbi:MAG: outer membrane lipoprotein LolB [Gammaproteobacteria bacterium]|nr:MAG: outer membrane lipoprotein LolB [Gammaproteobacteria bacterium]
MLAVMPKPFFLKVFSAVIGFCAAVSGCTSLPPASVLESVQFTVKGRLGVRNGAETFSSSFYWVQANDRFQIELWGPLGQGRTRMVGSEQNVTVYAANGEVYVDPDSASAMRRWLGFSVPIDALRSWIQGRQAPGYPTQELTRDERGDLRNLRQLGWVLVFSDYGLQEHTRRVPGRISASQAGVTVTLVPKDWTFSSTFQ